MTDELNPDQEKAAKFKDRCMCRNCSAWKRKDTHDDGANRDTG